MRSLILRAALGAMLVVGVAPASADPYPSPIVTKTTIHLRSTCVKVGHAVRGTVRVTSDAGVPTGHVRFFIDGDRRTTKALSSGQVSFALSTSGLARGKHTLRANYRPSSGSNWKSSYARTGFVVRRAC